MKGVSISEIKERNEREERGEKGKHRAGGGGRGRDIARRSKTDRTLTKSDPSGGNWKGSIRSILTNG